MRVAVALSSPRIQLIDMLPLDTVKNACIMRAKKYGLIGCRQARSPGHLKPQRLVLTQGEQADGERACRLSVYRR
jgi:hypothetical protein